MVLVGLGQARYKILLLLLLYARTPRSSGFLLIVTVHRRDLFSLSLSYARSILEKQ